MKIYAPEIVWKDGFCEYRTVVTCAGSSRVLWYKLAEEFGHLVAERCDSALVALIIPAMMAGEEVSIMGPISERLLHNLRRPFQAAIQTIIPHLLPVDVHAQKVDSSILRPTGVATGFSGGVDSFCTLADYYFGNVLKGYKVTHLLYNEVGAHTKPGSHRIRYTRLANYARDIGLPLVSIESNVDSFFKGMPFMQRHSLCNASVALLLQQGIGRFLYASAYEYSEVYIKKTESIAHSDPVILPLISTESMEAVSVGSEYSRVEKTVKITSIIGTRTALDVCVEEDEDAGNCSRCFKCLRTMLTLEAAGQLDSYENVFSFDVYFKNRSRYIRNLLRSTAPLERELLLFTRDRGIRFPALSRFCVYFHLDFGIRILKKCARSLQSLFGGLKKL